MFVKQTQLIEELQQLVNQRNTIQPVPTPRTIKPVPAPRTIKPMLKPIPKPRKSVKQTVKKYEDNIIPPPPQFRDGYKPVPKTRSFKSFEKPVPKPRSDLQKISTNNLFNFDDDIFQKENASLRNFKIIKTHNVENKKFNSFTNEYQIKILKPLEDDKEIYKIFHELIKKVKINRKLKDNDRIRIVIQNEELPNAISTKFNKVNDFKLDNIDELIKILEYKNIPLEKCKIIIQSVKIPNGTGRLYLSKDTATRKNCIITIKNNDTICLARSIVSAYANLKPECWTKTQVQDGFNKSRKLQKNQALKLHKDTNVEINDYGNDLDDVNKFANYLNIEINIIDSEQFNEIIYTANKGCEDKIYLYKTRNHFDVIKCLSCFTFIKGKKCEGKEINCEKCYRKFYGEKCLRITLRIDQR